MPNIENDFFSFYNSTKANKFDLKLLKSGLARDVKTVKENTSLVIQYGKKNSRTI